MPLKKLINLSECGYAHFILPLVVVVLVAVMGGYIYLHNSSAASAQYVPISGPGNKCIDNEYSKKVAGNKIQLYECNGTGAQEWKVNGTATAAGTIVNSNGYCLDIYQAKTTSRTRVDLYSCNGDWNQLWTYDTKTGVVQNPNSKLCLDDQWGGTANGNEIWVYTCNGSSAQKWTVHTSTTTTGGGSNTTGSGGGSTGIGSGESGSTGAGFITTSGTNWTTAQMDTFFAALPSDSLARFFAPADNTDSASYVRSVVKEADKYNIHLIIALADDDVDNNCDNTNSSNNGKTTTWYDTAANSGSTWYNWAKSVVTPLAKDPGVAMWEIGNEAFHNGVSIGTVGLPNAENYVNNSAADIRSFETAGAGSPKQLITVAPADIGEFNGTTGMEALFKNLDVVDDHDYSADADPGSPAVNTEFPALEQIGKALNKPYMVDEAGVEGGASCNGSPYNAWDNGSGGLSLQNRVTFLVTSKATDYFKNGASSVNFWLYTGTGGGCSYENIFTGDPIMSAVKNYVMP